MRVHRPATQPELQKLPSVIAEIFAELHESAQNSPENQLKNQKIAEILMPLTGGAGVPKNAIITINYEKSDRQFMTLPERFIRNFSQMFAKLFGKTTNVVTPASREPISLQIRYS
jgi:hypothetical protein